MTENTAFPECKVLLSHGTDADRSSSFRKVYLHHLVFFGETLLSRESKEQILKGSGICAITLQEPVSVVEMRIEVLAISCAVTRVHEQGVSARSPR